MYEHGRGVTQDDVKAAAEKLACTEVVLVNIGVTKPFIKDAHWTYFYDEDICFARLSYPSNFSPNVAPNVRARAYMHERWQQPS